MEDDHLQEFREFLEKTKRLSRTTITQYSYWIKDLDPAKLSQDYLNAYVQEKGNIPVMRGAILNFLEMTGLNKTFEMPPKATGRTPKRIVRGISDQEISTVRKHLYDHSFKRGLIFDLVYQGALRRVEVPTIKICSFQWMEWLDNIDKPCHLIVLGKGNKERVVLINPETAEMIFEHYRKKYQLESMDKIMEFSNSQSLLFTTNGKQISEWYVWEIIHTGSKKILGREIRTHELRHARATELEKMGVPIIDIKYYLGHSSLSTTEIYLHKAERESIENIKDILNHKGAERDLISE